MRKIPPYFLLDAFRGLAALWVVFFHASMTFLNENPAFIPQPWYAASHVGYLGVVLFFVISGYCISGAAQNALRLEHTLRRYAWDRFWRIYPPYLITCLLATAVFILSLVLRQNGLSLPFNYYAPPEPTSVLFWFSTVFLLQVEFAQFCLVMVFWTLCYEVAFYALVGVFLFLARLYAERSKSPTGVLSLFWTAIGVTTQFSLLWLIVSPSSCPFPFDRWYPFGLGALLFQWVAAHTSPEPEGRKARVGAWIQLAAAGILTVLFAALRELRGFSGEESIQAWVCVAFVVLLGILHPYERRMVQWKIFHPMMWLGTISYSLYLTHTIALPFVTTGMRNIGFDQHWYVVTFLTQVGVSILGGWLFFVCVERHFISTRQKARVVEEINAAEKAAP